MSRYAVKRLMSSAAVVTEASWRGALRCAKPALKTFVQACTVDLDPGHTSPKQIASTAHSIVKQTVKMPRADERSQKVLQGLYSEAVYSAALAHSSDFDQSHTYQLMWTAAKMAMQWPDLPVAHKRMLLQLLKAHADDMNTKQLSISLWALAKIGCEWRDLPLKLRCGLEGCIAAGLSDCSARDLSNLIWALAMMDMTVVKANKHLVHDLIASAAARDDLNDMDKTSICFGYYRLCSKLDLSDIDMSLLVRDCSARADSRPSYSQRKIFARLERMMLVKGLLQQEVFLYDAPVDIYCRQYNWVIEVDGPHHKAFQQTLSDDAHNSLRAQAGMTTVRIDLEDYDAMTSEQQIALLENVVDAMCASKPERLIDLDALLVVMPNKSACMLAPVNAGLFEVKKHTSGADDECKHTRHVVEDVSYLDALKKPA